MYIRDHAGFGQPPEIVKDFEEQKRRFEAAKADHRKRLEQLKRTYTPPDCPAGTQAGQGYRPPFDSAERNLTNSAAHAQGIMAILCGPSPWQAYLRANLKAHLKDLPRQPIRILMAGEFARQYRDVFGSPVPQKAQGFVDRKNALIYLKEFPDRNVGMSKVGLALHEAVHLFSHPPGRSDHPRASAYAYLGEGLLEGLTQVITEDILAAQGIRPMRAAWQAYQEYVPVARRFLQVFTPAVVGDAYFKGDLQRLFRAIEQRWTSPNYSRVRSLTNEKKTREALALIDALEKAFQNRQRAAPPISGPPVTAHGPQRAKQAGQAREARLRELAKWPHDAHTAWSKLGGFERNLVVWQMAANYGMDFARKFLSSAGKRKPKEIGYSYNGRGVGPKPAQLRAKGYLLAQKDSVHQWWVHPAGETVMRNYLEDGPGTVESDAKKAEPPARAPAPVTVPQKPAPRPPHCQDVDVLSNSICQNAEKICKIAAELGDEQARATCEKARAACAQARQRGTQCR